MPQGVGTPKECLKGLRLWGRHSEDLGSVKRTSSGWEQGGNDDGGVVFLLTERHVLDEVVQ